MADAMIAISTFILALLFLTGYKEIWLLFVISAIRAVGAGIQTPAIGAILPQFVPADKLTKVNGVNGTLQAIMMFVSPMVSAALLTMATLEAIFFIDVITAAVAILTLLLFFKIPVHVKAATEQTASYWSDFKQGLTYIQQRPYLKAFFLFFAAFFVLMAPASFLTPLQVTRTFGDDVWRLTAIEIAFSIGMMVGGAVIASWGGFRNRVHTMAFASLIMAVCTFALGLAPFFWLYLIFMSIFGIAVPLFNTPTTVLVQERVEESYLGRIFGVFSMISTSMMPIGMLIFGPIADVIAIEWLLIGTGVLMIVISLLLSRNKQLLLIGKPLASSNT